MNIYEIKCQILYTDCYVDKFLYLHRQDYADVFLYSHRVLCRFVFVFLQGVIQMSFCIYPGRYTVSDEFYIYSGPYAHFCIYTEHCVHLCIYIGRYTDHFLYLYRALCRWVLATGSCSRHWYRCYVSATWHRKVPRRVTTAWTSHCRVHRSSQRVSTSIRVSRLISGISQGSYRPWKCWDHGSDWATYLLLPYFNLRVTLYSLDSIYFLLTFSLPQFLLFPVLHFLNRDISIGSVPVLYTD